MTPIKDPNKGNHHPEPPKDVIIETGEVLRTYVVDTPLCPPAQQLCPDDISKEGIVDPDDVVVCEDKVIVRGFIRKLIPYIDDPCNEPRVRLVCVPVNECIPVKNARPGDCVAYAEIDVDCDIDEVRDDGTQLHEVMCVKVCVAVARKHCDIPTCPVAG